MLVKDKCPVQRDCSDSYYDSLCGKCSLVEKVVQKIPMHSSPEKSVASILGSKFSSELNAAYLWAYGYDITTLPTIQRANMEDPLLRRDMAKMMTNFALNVLGKKISTGTNCIFTDISSLTKEAKYYIVSACRL